MKIVFIGGRDIHQLGGIENYMHNLAMQLVKYGHEPVVYCESNRNEIEWVDGFKVIHQKSVGGRFLCKIILSYKATIQSLINNNGDVFHYNAWPPSLASWLPRLCGRKAILQGHGLEWKRTKYSSSQQKIMKFMERLTAYMHKNLIMVSNEQTEYFKSHYKRLCVTIPTAVNLPTTTPAESDILYRFNLENEGYYLYLGRLVQDKNPDYLIRAYLQSGINGRKLVIAGSNDVDKKYVDSLHKLCQGNPNIIFTDAVYGSDKNMLIRCCFAFCIPSTLEGLPITLLEAMSYRKICLASDIPANREALGESGVWCKAEDANDLANKMRYIIDNIHEIEWQREYNYKRIVNNFTWSNVTQQYYKYISSI